MPKCKYCNDPIKWKYLWGKTPAGEKNIPFNIDGSEHNLSCEVILAHRADESLVTIIKPFNTLTGKPMGELPKIAGINPIMKHDVMKKLDLILKKLDEISEMI